MKRNGAPNFTIITKTILSNFRKYTNQIGNYGESGVNNDMKLAEFRKEILHV